MSKSRIFDRIMMSLCNQWKQKEILLNPIRSAEIKFGIKKWTDRCVDKAYLI